MMSFDPFRLLGLDARTATDADVRRAYAERLKVTRPEDDRAGFMALRAAFEQARQAIRWRDQYGDDNDDPHKDDDDEDAQDHSPPDEYGQSSAETGRPPAPARMNASPAGMPVEADAPPDDPGKEDHEETEEYSDPVNRTMRALIDALTGAPFGPSVKRVMAIVEADDVAGIEDYQALQWQVRQLLCDRTGYYLEPQELRTPDWLRLDVFDALDRYFGWSRQPALQPWVRGLNDWLVRVRGEIEMKSLPASERRKAEFQRVRDELEPTKTSGEANHTALGWKLFTRFVVRIPFYIIIYFVGKAVFNAVNS